MQELADVARTFPVTSENMKKMDAFKILGSSAEQLSLDDKYNLTG